MTKSGKNKKYRPKWEYDENVGMKIVFLPQKKKKKINKKR